jgi:hypothetical protein
LEITMTSDCVEYLGAIEVEIDGIQYEIGLRRENGFGLRGIWTCITCTSRNLARELKPSEGEAIDLARLEIVGHHDAIHKPNQSDEHDPQDAKLPRQRVKKPR